MENSLSNSNASGNRREELGQSKPSREGDRYSELVKQIHALEDDLCQRTNTATSYEQRFVTLKERFDSLKIDHASIQTALTDTTQRCADLAAAKEKSERNYEGILANLRGQLQTQMADFEDLQARLEPSATKDVDALRTRIQEELEIPYRKRESELEEEISKTRRLYFDARRSHELLQSQFDQHVEDRKRELEGAKRSHDTLVKEMRARIAELNERVTSLSRECEESKTDGDDVIELKVQNEELVQENDQLRREKAVLSAAREKDSVRFTRLVAEKESEAKRAHAKRNEVERNLETVQVRLAASVDTTKRLEAKVTETDAELKRTRKQFEAERATNKRRQGDADIQIAKERSAHARQISDLRRRLDATERHLEEEQRERSREVTLATEREAGYQERLQRVRSTLERERDEARHEAQTLRANAEVCRKQLESARDDLETYKVRSKQEIVELEMKLKTLRSENERLNEESRREKERVLREDQELRDLRHEKRTFEERLGDVRRQLEDATKRNDRLAVTEREMRNEVNTVVSEKTSSMDQLREVYKQFALEKDAQHEREREEYRNKVRASKESERKLRGVMRALLERAKAKVVATEKRARKLRKRSRRLEHELKRERSNIASIKAGFNVKAERLWSRIRELQRDGTDDEGMDDERVDTLESSLIALDPTATEHTGDSK